MLGRLSCPLGFEGDNLVPYVLQLQLCSKVPLGAGHSSSGRSAWSGQGEGVERRKRESFVPFVLKRENSRLYLFLVWEV